MSDRFDVHSGERGIVRLFQVGLPAEEVDAFAGEGETGWPLKEALGAQSLNADYIELFPVSDLKGVGLAGYMAEGLGIDETEIAADRTRLDALGGHVLLVMSAAFGGTAQTLRPKAPLRWVGTYTEDTAPVKFEPLPSEAAKGTLAGPGAPPQAPSRRSHALIWLIAGLIVGAVVLTLVLALR